MIVTGTRGDLTLVARTPQPLGGWVSTAIDTNAGRSVSPESALAIAHVYGAVRLVSTTGGTLPLEVIDEGKRTRTVVRGGLLAPMLRHRPNRDMNASVVWSLVLTHLLLRGNAYFAKLRDASGRVNELYPLNPQWVTPFRDDNGRKVFRVAQIVNSRIVDAVFTPSDILHIIGPSLDDGLSGASPIEVVRNRMGVQIAQSEAQGRFYAKGMHAKGVLTMPAGVVVSAESMERVRQQWEQQNHGLDNVGRTPVLPGGLQYQPVSLSPADSQFIETMRWGATEVATVFCIPASRLNADSGTNSVRYANVGQDDVHYVKQAIVPPLTYIEAALNADDDLFGFTSSWVPRFNLSAALRADDKTRFEGFEIATGGQPWMTTAEVRDAEGLGAGGPEPAPVAADVAPMRSEMRGELVAARGDTNLTVNVGESRHEIVIPEQPTPVVNVAAPDVRVEAAPAPQVVVNVPEQPAPVVNVDVAAPNVDVAAPNVRVEPQITVELPAESGGGKRVAFQRDHKGFITGATVEEQ